MCGGYIVSVVAECIGATGWMGSQLLVLEGEKNFQEHRLNWGRRLDVFTWLVSVSPVRYLPVPCWVCKCLWLYMATNSYDGTQLH